MLRLKIPEKPESLFGVQDENLRYIQETLKVRVRNDGADLTFEGTGDEPQAGETAARAVFEQLSAMMMDGYVVAPGDVRLAANLLSSEPNANLRDYLLKSVLRTGKKTIVPRSLNQRRYLEQIATHDMVFGIGPAGTGKTYLAMAQAVSSLMSRAVARIILARPAVEAGEKLGFLPGDLQQKVDPYLRPLYDALYDMIEFEKVEKLLERHVIEVAPIAFMRGRTLSDAFVIVDEAQNTTPEQMKMVLTRIGFGSKVVVTGDITQVDLPVGRTSGLVDAIEVLSGIENIAFSWFDQRDVVRHKLVAAVIRAYDARKPSASAPNGNGANGPAKTGGERGAAS